MGEREGSTAKQSSKLSAITLPPRPSMDALFTGGGFGLSPGPMTLMSSFFSPSPGSEHKSFSQLLAGAMASPTSLFGGFNSKDNEESRVDDNSSHGSATAAGFKMNRPMDLEVSRSPFFTVPSGFTPSGLLNSPGFFSPQSPFGMSHQEALAQVTAQAAFAQSQMQMQSEELITDNPSFTQDDEASLQNMLPSTSEPQSSMTEAFEVSHSDRKSQLSVVDKKPADDGYNWRKYGQKPIKGSQQPRSYYKCTLQNCPAKKQVERSFDGQITEILYRGQHNHDKPQTSKRGKDNSDQNGNVNTQIKPEVGLHDPAGNMKKLSGIRRAQEFTQSGPVQSLDSSDSEGEGVQTREEDENYDEPNPKKRNTTETLSQKTVSESKIIVQTRSEVDILDDGYKWRKYGQKVVKGNTNPRSYYKCTSSGCTVRKHVERASADPKAVITTYEGKHNHNVPASRNSSHNNPSHHNNPPQLVPEKLAPDQIPPQNFGNNDQRPVLLRLKDEQIKV